MAGLTLKLFDRVLALWVFIAVVTLVLATGSFPVR